MSRIYLTQEQMEALRTSRRQNFKLHSSAAVPAIGGTETEEAAEPRDVEPEAVSISARPVKSDLKSKISEVYNQGQIGSCTANAICQALKMMEADTPSESYSWPLNYLFSNSKFEPSRLYLYTKERIVELQPGEKLEDRGADAEDGLEILMKRGVCSEYLWPYDTSKVNVVPPKRCDLEALSHRIHQISTVAEADTHPEQLINNICNSICQGVPVLIAIQIYESFESSEVTKTGNVPMPKPDEKYLGGHEVLIVGYDDETKNFLLVNSWGSDWGQEGYFTLPYEYITDPNLSFEFICITRA